MGEPPPCLILTPLAVAARRYWIAAGDIRFGLVLGAGPFARDALDRLILQHAHAAPHCPVRARIGHRLPALAAAIAPLLP